MVATLNVHLGANDGLYAASPRLPVEADGAREPVVVGETKGRHVHGLCLFQQPVQRRSAVQKAVRGMDMEVNKRHRDNTLS